MQLICLFLLISFSRCTTFFFFFFDVELVLHLRSHRVGN